MSVLTAPPIIGKRYRLHEELGKGGMGAVYHATDRLTGQDVALKRVFIPTSQLRFASYSENSDRFLALAQEFRVMASLRHPNIISVLDYGFDDELQPYFTMELLVKAQTLSSIAKGKSDKDKVRLLIQLLQALAYLHRRAIIHRDLKPSNILVVNGQIKVLDFGLSITQEQSSTLGEEIAGTVDFIAPEIFQGDRPSERSDLYAVGVIGYELFTGQRLFDGEDISTLLNQIVSEPPNMRPIKDKSISAVILRLLSKNPDDRYANADQTVVAFCDAIGQPVPSETAAIRESFLQAARFVGRDAEIRQLVDMLTQAKAGKGSLCLIGGESGVGKTRLLDELRVQALVQGFMVLRGQNVDEGYSPYQMWRGPLRWLSMLTDLTDDEASILKSIVPDIDTLLDRKIPDAPEVSALFAQERLSFIIEKIFAAQRHPILLILEDLHWVGSESLAILKRIGELIGASQLLIVGSYRDDERPELPRQLPDARLLKLNRLSKAGITELTTAMLGEQGRQPRLLDLLHTETEGNIFFLIEVVRVLAEKAGQLDLIGNLTLPKHVFAGGVAQVVQHRLSRVPDQARPLLRIAAVAGRYLDLKLLQQFIDSKDALDNWLTLCANTAVLEVQDGSWRFAHDKLREGVLVDLPADDRKDLHRQIASAIETVYLYSPEYTTAVAYHWAMAGDPAKEAHYAALAGKQALNSGAYEEAIGFLERASTLTAQEASSEKKQAALLRQIGEAFLGMHQYERARQLYQDGLVLLHRVDYRWGMAATLNDLGNVSLLLNEYAEAKESFERALKIAMPIRAMPVAIAAIGGLASVLAKTGESERALELVTFILQNSLTDRQTADRADELYAELTSVLDPALAAAAQDRGNAMGIGDVVKALTI